MRRFRFTIAQLAVFVVFVAVAAAALREASDLWDSAVFTLVLGLLVAAVVLAIQRAGARRAFWIGFAVVGSAYLGASLVPAIAPRLLTTKGLAYWDSKAQRQTVFQKVLLRWPQAFSVWASSGQPHAVVGEISQSWTSADVLYSTLAAGTVSSGSSGTTENFLRIGHSLIAVILAFAGGCWSRRLIVVGGSNQDESQCSSDCAAGPISG